MKKVFFVVMLCVLCSLFGFAQDKTETTTIESQNPASIEDLQRKLDDAAKATKRLETLFREANQESKNRSLKEQKAAKEILDQKIQEAKAREKILRSEIETREKERVRDATRILWIGGSLGFVLVSGILIFVLTSRKKPKIQIIPQDLPKETQNILPRKLENPKNATAVWKFLEDHPVLQLILERDGNLEIEASIKMPVKNTPFDNRESDCKILVTKGSRLLNLRFEDETQHIAWDNRFTHMAHVTLPNIDCKKTQQVS